MNLQDNLAAYEIGLRLAFAVFLIGGCESQYTAGTSSFFNPFRSASATIRCMDCVALSYARFSSLSCDEMSNVSVARSGSVS